MFSRFRCIEAAQAKCHLGDTSKSISKPVLGAIECSLVMANHGSCDIHFFIRFIGCAIGRTRHIGFREPNEVYLFGNANTLGSPTMGKPGYDDYLRRVDRPFEITIGVRVWKHPLVCSIRSISSTLIESSGLSTSAQPSVI
jgi:hypothetical protein